MPVRRDSINGGGVKVGRKPRVAVGSSKRSGDGVRAPRSKNSDDGEGHRKARVARDGLEGSSGAVRRLEEAKKRGMIRKVERSGNVDDGDTEGHRKTRVARDGLEGSSGAIRRLDEAKKRGMIRKVERSGNVDDGVTYRDVNGKSRDTNGRRKRDSNMRSGSEGFEGVNDGKSDRKRKRIGDELRMDNDMKLRGKTDYDLKDSRRKTSMKESGKFRVNKSLQNGKIMGAEKSRNVGFRGSGSLDKKVWTGKTNRADKPKHIGLGNGRSKITDKSNSVVSSDKPRYRKGIGKKNLVADSDLTEFLPKKKKRGIRIDPYDTSNKRLDDDISNKGDNQVKIDKTESSGLEMSKNAQFRTIRPSPSIISFVEENLLGRRREIEFRRAGYNIELPAPLDNIPFSTNTERERTEVPAFRNKLEFYAAAKVSSSFPPPELPEIAFAGRSNVGKSSLLNALTRQWGVVRTSDKPGLTQSINFFKLGPKLSLVDLPGYGFAYAKDEVKEAWEELVKEYVSTRVGLKRVCLLVDTKWGMKPRDLELIDLMERSETKYQIVLTKTDTVFPIDVARRAMQIEENLKAKKSAVQPLMMVSSKTGAGIRSLRTVLANVARFVKR